jgi:hypothetical protein
MSDVQGTSEELQKELLSRSKLTPKEGEAAEDFTVRVARKFHTGTDEEWEELSDVEGAQEWVNHNVETNEGMHDGVYWLLTVPETEQSAQEGAEEGEPDSGDEGMATGKTSKKGAKAGAVKNGNGEAKKAKKESNGRKGRAGRFPMDAVITVLATENPKRKGSEAASRFAKYKTGKTVFEMLTAGVRWTDLNWDAEHQHIKIG